MHQYWIAVMVITNNHEKASNTRQLHAEKGPYGTCDVHLAGQALHLLLCLHQLVWPRHSRSFRGWQARCSLCRRHVMLPTASTLKQYV